MIKRGKEYLRKKSEKLRQIKQEKKAVENGETI